MLCMPVAEHKFHQRAPELGLSPQQVCPTNLQQMPQECGEERASLISGRRKRGVRFKGGSRHEGFGVFEVKLLEPVISNF